MMLNNPKDYLRKLSVFGGRVKIVIGFGIFVFLFIITMMQQDTKSVIIQIKKSIYSGVYYINLNQNWNNRAESEKLLLEEYGIPYIEYSCRSIDDYEVYFSPSYRITIPLNEWIKEGYVLNNVEICQVYSVHNFNSGYLWAKVNFDVMDMNGNLIGNCYYGSPVGTKFKICKVKGEWKIIDFYEQEFSEGITQKIGYLLPTWNMDIQ